MLQGFCERLVLWGSHQPLALGELPGHFGGLGAALLLAVSLRKASNVTATVSSWLTLMNSVLSSAPLMVSSALVRRFAQGFARGT